MVLQQIVCDGCGTVGYIPKHRKPEDTGWEVVLPEVGSPGYTHCEACICDVAALVDAAGVTALKRIEAERLAADLALCDEFLDLAKQLYVADRIHADAYYGLVHHWSAVVVARELGGNRNLGRNVSHLVAHPAPYEAI